MVEETKPCRELQEHEADAPPPGYYYVWVEEDKTRMRLVAINGRKCRFSSVDHCPSQPVAQIRRGRRWWNYCANHLYGRRIINGQIVARRLEPVDPYPDQRRK